ncbi:hypothetical protein CHARACLAT_013346 [Characodon lateralis]|uniref:NudC N-terminal domain-containing protein n=1 Tax=Characodon lateralis TaxID=208331 RepID=A0ABU7F2M6_9TELE|nr:hypothetical protein [Characodon lateralis]
MASPLMMTEMYDNALLGIIQHVGNIQDFLQVYFGFLYRKTDFYRLLSGPNDRMGFPPGVAEKMVLKVKIVSILAGWVYRRHGNSHLEDSLKLMKLNYRVHQIFSEI